MLKKWIVGLVACASIMGARTVVAEVNFDQGVDVKAVVEQVKASIPQDAVAEKGLANWTIMVYVNAKNNLEKFGLGDVNEMEQVGSSDKVKIAVELGRMARYDTSDGGWKGHRRYIVQKDSDPKHISSPILQDIKKADMGDWNHLVDFVKWAQTTAPAQHYMLIVWNHGSGWDLMHHKKADFAIRGISYDDETGHHISTLDLGSALASIGKIDIYGSYACLMQMPEVDYQIKDYTDYVVGSEETEPGDGYTYNTFLGPIVARPSMTAAEVAKTAVDSYRDHYAQSNEGATQSAIRTSMLPQLVTRLNDWTKAVMAANETAAVKAAHSQALSFAVSDNKDLIQFVNLIGAATKSDEVKRTGDEVVKLLKAGIIENGTSGSGYDNANGLSIYLPNYSYNSDYDTLAWAKAGTWPQFAKWVMGLGSNSNENGSDQGGSGQDDPARRSRQ